MNTAVLSGAGGLLVGCVLNMAPEKYRGAVAQVPFVDIVTTMLDTSIPFLLRRASRYFRLGIQNRLRQYDLSFSHWFFLRALWLNDGVTQRELCRRIEAPEPAAVAALRVLERKGYVRRVRDSDNLRKILVFITPKGRALREKLLPHAFELASMGVKGLSEQELALLRSLLNKIHDNMVAALQAELGEIVE